MKIAVVAADGRTGRVFVKLALAAGHQVRAGVRGQDVFATHAGLETVVCDATDESQVDALLKGQDAVATFIGHIKGSAPNVQTEAMKTLVKIVNARGLRRIVSLTGTGVRFPGDKITLTDRVLNLGINVLDPKRVKDGKDHAEVLKMSGLDWTIIRVLKLQNTDPQTFSLQEHGPTKPYVSREEVASAALQVLQEGTFVQKAPIISR